MSDILGALVAGRTPPQQLGSGDLAAVVQHRLHGLLASAVAREEVELSAEEDVQLRATMLVERTHRKKVEATLDAVLCAAAGLEADVALFKGPALESQWYGAPLERPFGDLDVLLAPHHFDRADQLVEALQPGHPLLGSVRRLFESGRLQSVDVRPEAGAAVDLHADPLKIEIPMRQLAALWSDQLPVIEFAGRALRTLPAEHALVQMLLHLNKDRFAYLSNVADVVRMMRSADLAWGRVVEIAAAEGTRSHIEGAARRVADWTGEVVVAWERTGALRSRRPHGSLVWRVLWPARLVGQGPSGIARRRRRQLLIPLTARRRSLEAVRSLWRRWVRVDPVVRDTIRRRPG